jgi:hypothetical protein
MKSKNIILVTLLIIAICLRFIGGDIANFSYLVIAGYAFFGRAQVIQSLAILWFFSFIGPAITEDPSAAFLLRYVTIGGAAVSLLLHNYKSNSYNSVSVPVFATLFLSVFIVVHSMFFSLMVDVSILKAISWLTVVGVLLSAWTSLDYLERARLEMQLFGGLAVLMLLCLPLVFTELGYIRNGYAFQGISGSSQSWGLMMAILGSWLIGRLFERVKYRWFEILLLVLSLILLVMSATRTAGLALFLAVLGSSILFAFTRFTFLSFIRVFAVCTISMVAWFSFSDQLTTFMVKKDRVSNVLEIGAASRGILVFPMIKNILENPMTGIGFGVASLPSMRYSTRDSFFGLPISAPVEKGVTPIAALEELGLPGLLLVLLWVWIMIRRSYRSGFAPFVVLSTVLFTNLGEASMFSAGGMGLILLISLGWAVTGVGYSPKGFALKEHYRKKRGIGSKHRSMKPPSVASLLTMNKVNLPLK